MRHTVRLTAWIALAAAAVMGVGCATSGSAQRPPITETLSAHSEPDLVAEQGAAAGTSRSTASSTPERGPVKHTVEPGQTLYRIARTYDLPVPELMKANGITDPRTLAVGQQLIIPGVRERRAIIPPGAQEAVEAMAAQTEGRTAKAEDAPSDPGDGSRPAKERARPVASARPRQREAVAMPTGPGVLEWPIRGVLYARFGKKGKERHDGIDLAAPLGSPVKTARAGKVLYAGEQKGYGLIVIIDHGDDLITLYAHNRDLRVKTGQKVRDGQVVATVGESGRTSGPHVHFEVRQGGLPVDPLKFLGAPPGSKSSAVGRRRSN